LLESAPGRASTALVENLQVNYYGSKTPLRQLAGLSAPEPRLIVITPYDKGAMHEIEKAISTSDLGLTPMNDGKLIRIPIPRTHRGAPPRPWSSTCARLPRNSGSELGTIARDANDMLKELHKDKQATEDEMRAGEAKVQQFTTEFIEKIDKVLTGKETEIMEV